MEKTDKEALFNERDRRVAIFNQLMEEKNLDALVFTSIAQQAYQMAVKWATNYPLITRRDFCYMAKGGMPYLVVPTPGQAYNASKQSWLPEDHIIGGDMINHVVAFLKDLGNCPRVGLYTPAEIPVSYYRAMENTGAEFVDITERLTELRAPKSAWELNLLRKTSDLAIETLEWVIDTIRPGKTEREMVGGTEGYLRAHGAEDSLVLCRSIKPHTFITRATDTQIKENGIFVYSAEVAGPGGYWSQCVRPIFMSKDAQPEAAKILSVNKAALEEGLKFARPGYRICDVDEAIDQKVKELGCTKGAWSGHGMGADLGDGIDIGAPNKMPIYKGMILTLHPSVVGDCDGILYGNTYLITDGDPINLTPGYESCYLDEMKIELANKRRQ